MEDEDAAIDIDMDAPIATVFSRKKKLKTKRKEQTKEKAVPDGAAEGFIAPNRRNGNEAEPSPGIIVSEFDYSAENHFKAVDAISRLCGETEQQDFDPAEIGRLSSSITFIREWRQFSYPSKNLRFTSENPNEGKDFIGAVTLPQFSSAAVPKRGDEKADSTFSESSKDFVMNVGGLVSALDWCPRGHLRSNYNIRSEFIAVAAHPPDSCYHKLGVPVMGRGMVQVWCVLSLNMEKGMQVQDKKKHKQRSGKKEAGTMKPPEQKRPRGRPRKHPVEVNVEKKPQERLRTTASHESQAVESLAVPLSMDSSTLPSVDMDSSISNDHHSKKNSTKVQKVSNRVSPKSHSTPSRKSKVKARTRIQDPETPCKPSLDEDVESSIWDSSTVVSLPDTVRCDPIPNKCSIPNDLALPRMVLCLAHNGKVAWDVKWRPSGVFDKQRMGYLAVLLGNGALEVWEIPFPHTVKIIYSDSQGGTTDPRFMKLQPVFRCSRIMSGERQSIPLALEWSASSPHDMILAGCHDGVVALWKFCSTSTSQENRPLLCFSADTVPIRALSWAPAESSSESSNIFVTGGHKGLKFWDLRDPFRPLWELNPIQRIIYSLDWLPDPRCILVAFDDGTLRFISLSKAACDVPVTGKPFAGMVAYCGADGTALRFQLTTKAVEKDHLRNRAPHFLCGRLTEEDLTLTMFTPLPNIPFPMKKSDNQWSEAPLTKRWVTHNSHREKRTAEELEKVQTNDKLLTTTSNQASTSERNSKKNSEDDQQLMICGSNGQEISEGQQLPLLICGVENVQPKKFDEFPSKKVAMYRVRWNMNEGSENWLCFGGAAGVLRCQEIDMS